MDDRRMPPFTPPTPRSKRLGRELRKFREAAGLTLELAGERLGCSGSRVGRIEAGDIKAKPGDVTELLLAYGVPIDSEQAVELRAIARELRERDWWQQMGRLSRRYLTYIGFEAEATVLRCFEPTLVPGLLQSESYAWAIMAVGRETDSEAIEQRVRARMKRQEVVFRDPHPLTVHAIMSEAALLCEVGEPDVMGEQYQHIINMAALPNVTIQVVRFAAGAHLADHGGFTILGFGEKDPPLGYIETLAGDLFLESPDKINRLVGVWDHLRGLSLSPAESVKLVRELRDK